MAVSSLLLFGPQTARTSPEQFSQLRTSLLSEPLLRTFIRAIRNLLEFWTILVNSDPALQDIPGLEAVQALEHWLDQGDLD